MGDEPLCIADAPRHERIACEAATDEMLAPLLTRLEEAEKLFSLPLGEDEAVDAHTLYRKLVDALDPYALDKAIEGVLRGRRERWEKDDGSESVS